MHAVSDELFATFAPSNARTSPSTSRRWRAPLLCSPKSLTATGEELAVSERSTRHYAKLGPGRVDQRGHSSVLSVEGR